MMYGNMTYSRLCVSVCVLTNARISVQKTECGVDHLYKGCLGHKLKSDQPHSSICETLQ